MNKKLRVKPDIISKANFSDTETDSPVPVSALLLLDFSLGKRFLVYLIEERTFEFLNNIDLYASVFRKAYRYSRDFQSHCTIM